MGRPVIQAQVRERFLRLSGYRRVVLYYLVGEFFIHSVWFVKSLWFVLVTLLKEISAATEKVEFGTCHMCQPGWRLHGRDGMVHRNPATKLCNLTTIGGAPGV